MTTEVQADNETLELTRSAAELDITEAQVVGEDETATTVELEERVIDAPEGADEEDGEPADGEETEAEAESVATVTP